MRKVTRYKCELCGATYETEDKARECEASHKIGNILNFGGRERQGNRAKTFPGIAKAMAEQWG